MKKKHNTRKKMSTDKNVPELTDKCQLSEQKKTFAPIVIDRYDFF